MIIWVASYPKSGNTWVRSIISSLVYTENGIFDFPSIKKIDQYPQRRFLEYFTQDYNNIHEIKKHWITSQERINLDTKIKFFKTHHLNCKIDNYPFTNKECTRATIYIVRDPRNVITSLKNHYSLQEDEALIMINSIYRNLRDENDHDNYSNYSFISSWANNYNSWKISKNINILIVKYEDLENHTNKTFLKSSFPAPAESITQGLPANFPISLNALISLLEISLALTGLSNLKTSTPYL